MNEWRETLDAYVRDRRKLEIPNYTREDLGTVVRYTPIDPNVDGIVCFASIPEGRLEDEIARHVFHFDRRGSGFEWKVYDFDQPRGLKAALRAHGFEEGDLEVLMAYDLVRTPPKGKSGSGGVDIRRLQDAAEFQMVVDLQETVWKRPLPWLLAHLESVAPICSFFCAFCDGAMIGTSWIEYPHGSQFAEIHGGAVLPEFRSRGIYSQLFDCRVKDAVGRGVRFIAVDAAPMSLPILERKGFERLSGTSPLTKHRARDGH